MAKKIHNNKIIIAFIILLILLIVWVISYLWLKMQEWLMSSIISNKLNSPVLSEKNVPTNKVLDDYRNRQLSNAQIFTQKYDSFQYASGTYITGLEKKISSWVFSYDEIKQAIYINDMEWKYDNSKKFITILCEKFKDKCTPEQFANLTINGYVKDNNNIPLKWVRIFSDEYNASVLSDEKGFYSLTIKTMSSRRVSIKASLMWYSDDFFRYSTSFETHKNIEKDIMVSNFFRLNKADNSIIHKSLTHDIKKNIIKSWIYEYDFKNVIFYDQNGKSYVGPITVYTYFFNRENWTNLISLNVFNQTRDYLWNWMVTFGMPYVMVYDNNGNELDIKSSASIKGKWQILYMHEISKEYLDNLENMWLIWTGKKFSSRSVWWFSSMDFPFFWWLNRKTGVWYDEGFVLLNRNGDYEFDFYTIK